MLAIQQGTRWNPSLPSQQGLGNKAWKESTGIRGRQQMKGIGIGRGQILVGREEASVDGLQRSCRWCRWCSTENGKGRAEPSRSLGGMRWWKLWKEKVQSPSDSEAGSTHSGPNAATPTPPRHLGQREGSPVRSLVQHLDKNVKKVLACRQNLKYVPLRFLILMPDYEKISSP